MSYIDNSHTGKTHEHYYDPARNAEVKRDLNVQNKNGRTEYTVNESVRHLENTRSSYGAPVPTQSAYGNSNVNYHPTAYANTNTNASYHPTAYGNTNASYQPQPQLHQSGKTHEQYYDPARNAEVKRDVNVKNKNGVVEYTVNEHVKQFDNAHAPNTYGTTGYHPTAYGNTGYNNNHAYITSNSRHPDDYRTFGEKVKDFFHLSRDHTYDHDPVRAHHNSNYRNTYGAHPNNYVERREEHRYTTTAPTTYGTTGYNTAPNTYGTTGYNTTGYSARDNHIGTGYGTTALTRNSANYGTTPNIYGTNSYNRDSHIGTTPLTRNSAYDRDHTSYSTRY